MLGSQGHGQYPEKSPLQEVREEGGDESWMEPLSPGPQETFLPITGPRQLSLWGREAVEGGAPENGREKSEQN